MKETEAMPRSPIVNHDIMERSRPTDDGLRTGEKDYWRGYSDALSNVLNQMSQ